MAAATDYEAGDAHTFTVPPIEVIAEWDLGNPLHTVYRTNIRQWWKDMLDRHVVEDDQIQRRKRVSQVQEQADIAARIMGVKL